VEIHQLALLTGWAIYLHLFIALPQAWWIIMGFVVLVPLSMSRREARAFAAQLTEVAGVGTVARRQRIAYDESRSIDTAPLIGALDAITRRFSYPEKGWGVELLRHDVGVADEADAADAATESDETESAHDAEADAGAHAGGVSFRAIDRLREAGVPCHRHWRHWHDTWNLGAPTIPASLVRTLPYDTITAVVAMRACMIGGVPKATPYERPPRRISPIAMVVLLSSSVVGVAALSMISGRPSPFVVLIFVYAILPPMLLIFTQATQRSPGATGSHAESTIYYRKAHALWRDVARPDDASEAAMVLHLLTFERAMNPKAEADELMRAYFEKLHYRRLLGGAGSPIFAETRARAENLLASPSLHQATIAEKASTGEEVRAGTPAPSGAGGGGGGAGHRPHRLNAR
jgi:hypothetical protein